MNATPWLAPVELRAWVGFMAAAAGVEAAMDRRTRETTGLSHASYGILAMLSGRANRTAHMHELAVFTGQSGSRLSHAVARLEDSGYVTRARCAENARFVDATLTAEGRRLMVRIAPQHLADVRRVLHDRLTAEQVAQLAQISAALLDGLREAGQPALDLSRLDGEGGG